MGPLMGSATKEIQAVGKDIMIAIDLSQSMNATDVQPSRLEKVKFELKNIVKAFDADRIGIIMFSSEAFVGLSPHLRPECPDDVQSRRSIPGLCPTPAPTLPLRFAWPTLSW